MTDTLTRHNVDVVPNNASANHVVTSPTTTCNACGFEASFVPEGMIPCDRCMAVYYCSVDCLQWDWKSGAHCDVCVDHRDDLAVKKQQDELCLLKQQEELAQQQLLKVQARRASLDALVGTVHLKEKHKEWEEKNRKICDQNMILSGHLSKSLPAATAPPKMVPSNNVVKDTYTVKKRDSKKKKANSNNKALSPVSKKDSQDDTRKRAQNQADSSTLITDDEDNGSLDFYTEEEIIEEIIEDDTEYEELEIDEDGMVVVIEEVVGDGDSSKQQRKQQSALNDSLIEVEVIEPNVAIYEEVVVEDDDDYEEEVIEEEELVLDDNYENMKLLPDNVKNCSSIFTTRNGIILMVGVAMTAVAIAAWAPNWAPKQRR